MRRVLLVAIAAATLAAPAPAGAADCVTYPGDDAPQQTLAVWMAYGAAVHGVPGELPVRAALVELGRQKRRGRHARAALTITAADAAGNSTSEQRRVRIF